MKTTISDPYRTTYHRDGSVTLWSVHAQRWTRIRSLGDETAATLSQDERGKIERHFARHAAR